jgi:hypothetical protein
MELEVVRQRVAKQGRMVLGLSGRAFVGEHLACEAELFAMMGER